MRVEKWCDGYKGVAYGKVQTMHLALKVSIPQLPKDMLLFIYVKLGKGIRGSKMIETE